MIKKPSIIFLGTPEFAVPSLEILIKNDYNILAVVTVADKPAGRGQKINSSPVKQCAEKHGLKILQPSNLKDEKFLEELESLKADLQIVVAFRMLPEAVWKMPKLGTFNLHGSLLPHYRGAAPINWAIINGENKSGVTTFFLKHEIDTGNIILQKEVNISTEDSAGTLHDKMMEIGSELVLETVKLIENGKVLSTEQNKLIVDEIKTAPKLNRANTSFSINFSPDQARNFIRGLNPFPAAHTEIYNSNGIGFSAKIFSAESYDVPHSFAIGKMETDNKNYLRIYLKGGYLHVTELQISGRTKMKIKDFLNGVKLEGEWVVNQI